MEGIKFIFYPYKIQLSPNYRVSYISSIGPIELI